MKITNCHGHKVGSHVFGYERMNLMSKFKSKFLGVYTEADCLIITKNYRYPLGM